MCEEFKALNDEAIFWEVEISDNHDESNGGKICDNPIYQECRLIVGIFGEPVGDLEARIKRVHKQLVKKTKGYLNNDAFRSEAYNVRN